MTDQRPIRLKGRSFLALTLSPEKPFDQWLERLDDLAARSTGFFLGRPIVLDLAGVDATRDELKELIGELGERSVRIMGIEGAKASQLGMGMPPEMKGGRPAGDIEAPQDEAASAAGEGGAVVAEAPAAAAATRTTIEAPAASAPSLIIEAPVRSGQSIIHPEGDVTVLGSVASGAEIVAGGSIHVYGALRGRAMAGSCGNAGARIFCRRLEAELVAIDGLYKTAEDLDSTHPGQSVHVWLDGDALKVTKLS